MYIYTTIILLQHNTRNFIKEQEIRNYVKLVYKAQRLMANAIKINRRRTNAL